ncbi:MAG: nucleoside hydrolase [Eubacteriales bacterium]|nr:nucleoside hydrolase [Eubacteriales bacterium]
MKKLVSMLLTAGMVGTMLSPLTAAAAPLEDYKIVTNAESNKVIFDTDMGYFGDDTYALFMLLQADAANWIDLLGVTSVGGNVTIAEGTTAILNQLEKAGRDDIPVYMGTDRPTLGLHDDATIEANGLKRIKSMDKVLTYGDTISYDNLGDLEDETWGYSTLKPQEDKAWEFMVEQVNANPGKVTIIAVGACTNVAMAIQSDPGFAAKTAGIYYMGGAIDVPGNDTPCAERNWYYDPEAVDICLQADFPQQVVVPHDISYNQVLTKDLVEHIVESGDTIYNKMIEEYALPRFIDEPDRQQKLWDAQVPGIFLCPDLISKTDVRDIAMETNMGYTYGESVAWAEGTGPAKSATCTVVYDVDGEAYWDFVAQLYSTEF